jgi:hypothetical protein
MIPKVQRRGSNPDIVFIQEKLAANQNILQEGAYLRLFVELHGQ